jgi:hypothetical protein
MSVTYDGRVALHGGWFQSLKSMERGSLLHGQFGCFKILEVLSFVSGTSDA